MELMVYMMTMIHYPVLIVIDHESFYFKDTPFILYSSWRQHRVEHA